jgi:hypothetical protein
MIGKNLSRIILMVVTDFLSGRYVHERHKMSQTTDHKNKTHIKHYSRETYTDRRARMFESSAVRHAKQLGFLTGEDVLKSAETESSGTSQGEAS